MLVGNVDRAACRAATAVRGISHPSVDLLRVVSATYISLASYHATAGLMIARYCCRQQHRTGYGYGLVSSAPGDCRSSNSCAPLL